MSHPIRVLCVDDSPDLADVYRMVIDAEPHMRCVGIVTRPEDIEAEVARTNANHVLLDLTMPGAITPLVVIGRLARSCPGVRVIVCSGYDDEATQNAALDAGAWGFVSKHGEPTEVLAALRQVARGQVFLPGRLH